MSEAFDVVRLSGASAPGLATAELPAGITVHAYGRTRGFLARVYSQGTCERKLFSWRAHGSVQAAFDAAVAWQTTQKAQHPAPREPRRVPGYGYVVRGQRSYRDAEGAQRHYPAFIAWLWDGQRPHQTSYSVVEHGEAQAERLCYAWLERERASLGLRAVHSHDAPDPAPPGE